jgi:glycogen debranching enzyme
MTAGQATESSSLPGIQAVTLLEGSSFCRSSRSGDIEPSQAQGLFVKDTRLISTWELLLDNEPIEPLSVVMNEPFSGTFIGRAAARPMSAEPTVVVERHRLIANGMREDIVLRNFGAETLGVTMLLVLDADFADLFDVKEGRRRLIGLIQRRVDGDDLELSVDRGGNHRGVRVHLRDGQVSPNSVAWRITVPPRDSWRTTVQVLPWSGDEHTDISFPIDRPIEEATPSRRMRDWRANRPRALSDSPALQEALEQSVEDLGALRITDPARPELDVVAAGAPWFMALFGRDSLLTSWMTLPWDPGLARGTLHTLARLQGRRSDPLSEEEPGRILHEVRLGLDEDRALGGSLVYYGSVDATPLFVMLLGEAARWGMSEADVEELLPAADRALEWIEHHGDIDGDGFVESHRKTDRGLINQGWKDSHDSMTFRDGRLARGPIAISEVQAYVYGAYRARSDLAAHLGDDAGAKAWADRAEVLKARFDAAFWMPELGYYAMALDGDKRSVDALASNQGHCLWTGIVPDERVDSVVEHLLSPTMFTGWGIRTLADTMAAFNPVSYHNGSVWPHDNAIIVQGLSRYGEQEAASIIATALIDACRTFDGRLPELFCGFSRGDFEFPVPYPTSCSPQAWAAATPIALVTAMLQLQPDVASGTVTADGELPKEWGHLQLTGLNLGDRRIDVESPDLR